MKLPLTIETPKRLTLQFAAPLVLLSCIYLAGKRGVGDLYFERHTPASTQTAMKWDSANPQYYDALGTLTHMYGITGKLDESVSLYETAAHLGPSDAHYWSDLGAAYDWAGRSEEASRAFRRAIQLFPNSPEINWRFANFAVRTHRFPEALQSLRVVLASNSPAYRDVFRLAATAARDDETILEILPSDARVFLDFLNFEMAAGNVLTAERAWRRLLELKLPFDLREAFPYLDALIQRHEPERLATAWAALAERFPAQIGPLAASNTNLVTNGSFERDVLNGGLDWRVVPVEGAAVSLDSQDPFDGSRAIRIEFDGKHNLDYGHILQYVPVQPNTRYRFSAAMRATGITTDSGPRFQIFDAFDLVSPLQSTENIVGTSNWSSQQVRFKTNARTSLLVIRVARPPSSKIDNQISGTVWIDQVSLTPEN